VKSGYFDTGVPNWPVYLEKQHWQELAKKEWMRDAEALRFEAKGSSVYLVNCGIQALGINRAYYRIAGNTGWS
jgi:hypothetical protein